MHINLQSSKEPLTDINNIVISSVVLIRKETKYPDLQIQELFQAEVQATLIVQWELIF